MAAKSLKFKLTMITGDEVVYIATNSELKYALQEITQGNFLLIDGEYFNTEHIFKFEYLKEV